MRNNNFDFLRFILAFNVVISHLIGVTKIDIFQPFQPFFNAYTSVTCFFVISGFLIVASYIRSNSLKDYLKKRASRLLPAYLFVIICSALFLVFVSQLSFHDYFVNTEFARYLFANLSFLNFLQPSLPGVFTLNNTFSAVNGALWTLKIEVGFYLIIPLIVLLISKINKKYIVFILIYILSICYKIIFEYLSHEYSLNFSVFANQLPGFMSYFVSGIACYYYFNFFKAHNVKLLFIAILILLIERVLDVEIATPVSLSIIVFFIAFNFSRLNNFAKFGDISYGIYIYHLPLLQLAIHFELFKKYNPILVSILFIVTVLSVGMLSWHLLEKRYLKRGKNQQILKKI
jgi:peptidoglycan/LPS O-acetylase OafA/YrhL